MNEIKLMKEIGKHQNVLSFLGCWTVSEPFLLIIEYIAHGDLLHWLRRKRSQVSQAIQCMILGKNSKLAWSTLFSPLVLFFCKILLFLVTPYENFEIRLLRNHYQSNGSFFSFSICFMSIRYVISN